MKKFAMTPALDQLLRGDEAMPIGLYQLSMATPEQLTRLHYAMTSLNKVKEYLKLLCDQGYAQYDAYPVKHVTPRKKFYSSRYYYMLGDKGAAYLRKLGMDAEKGGVPKIDLDTFPVYLKHQLELNDLIIAAALLKKCEPNYYLHGMIPQQIMSKKPYKALSGKRHYQLIPDAFLDFGMGKDDSFPLLLEYDRGTEEISHFKRRIRAYSTFLASGDYRDYLGTKGLTVAFCTFKGDHRRDQMRQWTYEEIGRTPERESFIFASLDNPEPKDVWLEPRWYMAYQSNPQGLLTMS